MNDQTTAPSYKRRPSQKPNNTFPSPAAVVAVILYPDEYAAFAGGTMDFWESLDPMRQRLCEQHAHRIIRAWRFRNPNPSRL